MTCEQCDALRARNNKRYQLGEPCDICDGTAIDFLGRPCRHCSTAKDAT